MGAPQAMRNVNMKKKLSGSCFIFYFFMAAQNGVAKKDSFMLCTIHRDTLETCNCSSSSSSSNHSVFELIIGKI